MSSPFKVHELLSRAELDALEQFAREPGRTIDECHTWLLGHGFTLSRGAVGNWKQAFDLTDRFRAANTAARDLMACVAQEKGAVALSDAATVKLNEMLFSAMLKAQEGGDGPSVKDLWALSMTLKNVVQGKRHIEKLKEEMAAALADAEKDARGGASGEAVVSKVREILGIKS